jgi:predicted PhzF superfamily epimerase YddE/YHI9
MLVVDSAATVRDAWPTSKLLQTLPGALQTITAPAEAGSGFDCVSRTFAAKLGTYEDAVCGSAHSMIAPYWAGKLGKCDIVAQQASKRGGTLWCEVLNGGRVRIEGNAALYSAADVLAGLEGCPTCK